MCQVYAGPPRLRAGDAPSRGHFPPVTARGVVTELTPGVPVPVENVGVYGDPCGELGHSWSFTDSAGRYSFPAEPGLRGGIWLSPGVATSLQVSKEGYALAGPEGVHYGGLVARLVMITGDTTFDIQLVRQPSTGKRAGLTAG